MTMQCTDSKGKSQLVAKEAFSENHLQPLQVPTPVAPAEPASFTHFDVATVLLIHPLN